jgi:hypothetical protein
MIILGVGSRILVAFNGWDVQPAFPFFLKWFQGRRKYFFHLFSLTLILGSFLRGFFHFHIGAYFTLACVLFTSLVYWKIFRFPAIRLKLNWGIWLSQWFFILGQLGFLLSENLSVHYYHLYSIGGIGLMTLMIATRVVAHGGFNVEKESQSRMLYGIAGLTFLTATTRWSAGLIPSTYESHLFYASTLWIVVLLMWTYKFGTKIWSKI